MRPRRQERLALGASAAGPGPTTATTAAAGDRGSSHPSRRRRLASSATMATVTALAGLLLLLPAEGFMGPAARWLAPAAAAGRAGTRSGVAVGAGRNEEWETNNGEQRERDNPWATQQQQQAGGSDNDWYMTGRIHYLREMEKLGQELHDLMDATGESGAAGGINGMILNGPGAAGMVPEAGPGAAGMAAAALSEHEKAAREAASQEEMRRQEVLVAESCALNWREEPVFAKPVGFVPGNRKVQQVRLCDSRVMYGSDSGFVGLASAADGRELFRLQAHSALVTALDYDAETGWALSAADDGVVHVYRETPEGRMEQAHGPAGLRLHSNRVVAAEVLDHRWGLTASMDGKILIFELDSGAVVQELWASDTLLALSVCKGYVFVGLMSGVCEAFSIRNGGRSAFRYIAQRTPIRSLRTFPLAGNQIKVVAGGQDGAIRQFHVRPVHVHVNSGNAGEHGVWKVPSDRSFDDRLVLLCNTHVDQEALGSGSERADQGFLLKGHKAPVVAVACDETKVVSASEDGTLIVWDAVKGSAAYTIRQHVDGDLVSAIDFNERYLVVDGTRGKVVLFDYSVGRPPRKASNSPLSSSSGRPSRKGASSSRNRGGPKPSRGQGQGQGPQPGRNNNEPQQPPPQFPQAPFPFIGGWNLGHGPTDSVDGLNGGMNAGAGAGEGAMGDGAAEGGAAGPGEDED